MEVSRGVKRLGGGKGGPCASIIGFVKGVEVEVCERVSDSIKVEEGCFSGASRRKRRP